MSIPHWHVYRIDVLCSSCDEKDLQRIGEMIGQDSIACRICDAPIDISTSEWRTAIKQHCDAFSEITITVR